MKKLFLLFAFLTNLNFVYSQWESVGPNGGSIENIYANNSYLFVSMTNNGLYRSSNNGGNWSRLSLNSDGGSSILAGNGSNLICGMGDVGIFKSSDNGNSWTSASTGLPTGRAKVLVINNNAFYISFSSTGGLYKSTDNGLTWNIINSMVTFSGLTFSGSNMFGRDGNSVSFSTNSGLNWSTINSGLPQGFSSNGGLAITSTNSSVFIGMDSSNIGKGVYRTTNNGQNWFLSSNGLTNLFVNKLYSDGNVIYAGTRGGVFKSNDNGNSWISINSSIEPIDCESFFSIGSNLYAGFGREYSLGGLYLSINNGNTWNSIISNIKSCLVQNIKIKGATLFACVNGSGINKSVDNGNNWIRCMNGLPYNPLNFNTKFLATDGQNIYCSISGNYYKSSDDGNSWVLYNGFSLSPTYIATNNNFTYSGTAQGIYVTSNFGNNWALLGLQNKYVGSVDFYNQIIFAGTTSGVFQSTDNGTNWQQINTGLIDTSISDLKVSGQNIYISIRNTSLSTTKIYKRSAIGGNWIQVNNGLPDNFSLKNLFSIGSNIVFTTYDNSAIYVSRNEGQSWNNMNQGLTAPFIFGFSSTDSYAFTGTYGGAVCRRLISELIGINQISSEIPSGFSLSQNYPNPFNPTTNIEFSLHEKSFVKLKVFDISGKEIQELVNDNFTAGTYKYEFNVVGLSSGTYFYRLETDKFTETKKMVVLK